MSADGYHQLRIQVHGITWHVYGNKGTLNTSIEEWDEWIKDVSREENALLTVYGITNTVDRASQTFVCKMESIEAMDIYAYS